MITNGRHFEVLFLTLCGFILSTRRVYHILCSKDPTNVECIAQQGTSSGHQTQASLLIHLAACWTVLVTMVATKM